MIIGPFRADPELVRPRLSGISLRTPAAGVPRTAPGVARGVGLVAIPSDPWGWSLESRTEPLHCSPNALQTGTGLHITLSRAISIVGSQGSVIGDHVIQMHLVSFADIGVPVKEDRYVVPPKHLLSVFETNGASRNLRYPRLPPASRPATAVSAQHICLFSPILALRRSPGSRR